MKNQFAFLAVILLLAPGHGWAGQSGGGGAYVTADGLVHFIDGANSSASVEHPAFRIMQLPDPISRIASLLSEKAQELGDEETLAFIKSLPSKSAYVVPFALQHPVTDQTEAKLLAELGTKAHRLPRALIVRHNSIYFQQGIIHQAPSDQIEFELLQSARPNLSFGELIQLQQRYQSLKK